MNRLLKRIYYSLPFKRQFFIVIRRIFKPSVSIAGYLKFIGPFVIKLDDKKLKVYNDNLTVPTLLFWRGIKGYEQTSLNVWMQLSREAKVILNIGANIGLFGLLSKAVNKNSRVTCFEPLARNCKLILKNIELNKFDIEVVQVAMSSKEGFFTFYDMREYDNTIGSFDKDFVLSHSHHKELCPVEVKTLTLDAWVTAQNLSKLDLVKIDVEGHEFSVVDGGQGVLRKYKPSILLEVSDKYAKLLDDLLRDIYPEYLFYNIVDGKGIVKVDSIVGGEGRNFLITNNISNLPVAI